MIATKTGIFGIWLGFLEEHIAYSSLNLFHVLSENDNWMVATKTLLFGFWIGCPQLFQSYAY